MGFEPALNGCRVWHPFQHTAGKLMAGSLAVATAALAFPFQLILQSAAPPDMPQRLPGAAC